MIDADTCEKRPRVAFVTSVYDHTAVGGGTFVQYLRRAVEENRMDITFFSDDMREVGTGYEHAVELPAVVRRLPGGWITRAWYYHRAVRAAHLEQPFDVIWHNNAITSFFDVVRDSPVPVVGMINDYNNAESRTPLATRSKFGGRRALIRFAWYQLERFVARRVDVLIVNSNFMVDQIKRFYGVDSRRIRRLYKGVDLAQFEFAPRVAPGRPVRILFVKNDYVRGGLFDLFRALAGFPVDVEMTVIGPPGEAHSEILRAAEETGASGLRLVEHVSRADMPEYFRSHDILCVPSRSEALGVSFMEALASGTPAVGGRVGGIPEVLDHGRAGWLVEPQNPESIRDALLEVITNDRDRSRKVQHGRAHVNAFSTERMIEAIEEITWSISREARLVGA